MRKAEESGQSRTLAPGRIYPSSPVTQAIERRRAMAFKMGFRHMSGPRAGKISQILRQQKEARSVSWKGNIDEPLYVANYEKAMAGIPIDYLKFPEKRLEYNYFTAKSGFKSRVHVHDSTDELYLILKGQGIITIGGRDYPARKHDVFHILAGTWHSVENPPESGEDLAYFIVLAPPVPFHVRVAGFSALSDKDWENLGYGEL